MDIQFAPKLQRWLGYEGCPWCHVPLSPSLPDNFVFAPCINRDKSPTYRCPLSFRCSGSIMLANNDQEFLWAHQAHIDINEGAVHDSYYLIADLVRDVMSVYQASRPLLKIPLPRITDFSSEALLSKVKLWLTFS